MYKWGDQRTFFGGCLEKLILLLWKLWMSGINSVTNLRILYFSKKN